MTCKSYLEGLSSTHPTWLTLTCRTATSDRCGRGRSVVLDASSISTWRITTLMSCTRCSTPDNYKSWFSCLFCIWFFSVALSDLLLCATYNCTAWRTCTVSPSCFSHWLLPPQESFDGLLSLKQLMIDHNRIEEIQPGAFTQMGSLNLLSLTHNRLIYLPNMAFQGLLNIQWLKLSHNSLNNLATEAFASLFTLTRLSLDHNELQFFPTQTMTR